ncbi:MAG: pilus assembly protein [Parvibaculaceae bacterium]
MTKKGTGTGDPRHTGQPSFRRNDSGSVAVEFGLISIPFFMFLFALIETAFVFFASVTMEGAMEDAARMLRTGTAQSNGMTAAQFKQEICQRSPLFFDCDQKLVVDVRTFDAFANVNFTDPLDANGDLANNFQFSPGQAGDVVMVRAFYIWDVLTPIGIGLENMSGGSRLLTASAVFRNEPFGAILP